MKQALGSLTERGRVAIRFAGGVVLVVLVFVLLLQVASTLLAKSERLDEVPPDADRVRPAVTIRAQDAVRLRVEVDGEERWNGSLCGNCEDNPLEFSGEREVSVALPDLTRATVTYDGRRIEPLGNVSEPRTLVFVDDRVE